MTRHEEVLDLVGEIYEVALKRRDWSSVLGKVSGATGGQSALMRLVDCRRECEGFVAAFGYEDVYLDAYRDHFVHLDPYRAAIASAPPGSLLLSDQVVPLRSRRHTEYYHDYELPQDRMHAIGSPLGREKDFLLYLGLQRGRRAGPYESHDIEIARSLLPHVLRAVQIQRLLGEAVEAQQLCEAALDRLQVGVIFLDTAGAVRFANAASRQLAAAFGLRVGEAGIGLPDREKNARLQKLVALAATATEPGSHSAGGDLSYHRSGLGMLQMRVFPFAPKDDCLLSGHSARVVIFLVRPGAAVLSVHLVAEQFRLTPAEARLAIRLAEGHTLEQTATDFGIAVSTAKSQLMAVFGKTGTRRQTELVILVLTSLAAIDRGQSEGTSA